VLLRATPYLAGVAVEGADRVVVFRDGKAVRARRGAPLAARNAFVLSAGEATVAAVPHVRGSLLVDPTVERVGGFARKVWLAEDGGLRAAWRVRVPTYRLADLSDVWVDAETGAVLKKSAVARFQAGDGGVTDGGDTDAGAETDAGVEADAGADVDAGAEMDAGTPPADSGAPEVDAGPAPAAPTAAKVFQYAPDPAGVDSDDLVDVNLEGLLDAFPGGYLRGKWVETYNCCKTYVCLDGSNECELADRRCATTDDVDPVISELALEIPTTQFQGQLPFAIPDPIFGKAVFCSELPRVTSTAEGWTADPVDVTRAVNDLAGLASEEDAFAEIQAYYATMQFFTHLRGVLGDDTWCLGGLSMQCESDGEPTLDTDGTPVRPYHVATNLLIPELDFTALAQQVLPPPAGQGRGGDVGNPVVIDQYQRLDNAAFVPALEGGGIDIPEEFADLVDIFNRPYDSNLYFQGQHDFAYDGDIVFHEFTHAVVHSYLPTLGSLGYDEWGGHAEMGAMNEGWSDYFSGSFTDDPVTGEYGAVGINAGELGLRDMSGDQRCPESLTGEVHDDSEPWSAALWDIREAVVADQGAGAVDTLDQALLLALAQSDDDESFEAQSQRVLDAVEDAFGAGLRGEAEAALTARGVLDCERVLEVVSLDDDGAPVSTQPGALYLNDPDSHGLTQSAPAVVQYRIEAPASTSGFTMTWLQSAGAQSQFTGGGGDPVVPVVLAVESDTPIQWQYTGTGAQTPEPFDTDGNAIAFDPLDETLRAVVGTPNNNGVSSANFAVSYASDACASKVFHVQFVNRTGQAQATGLEIAFTDTDETCQTGEGEGEGEGEAPEDCACTSAHSGAGGLPFGVLALLALAALARRRRS
jgi:MYXO-CTERM domain-containing protein